MEEKNNKLNNLEKIEESVALYDKEIEKIEEPVSLDDKKIEKLEEKISTDTQNIEQRKISTDTQNIAQEKISIDTKNIAQEKISTDTQNSEQEKILTDTQNIEQGKISTDTKNIEQEKVSTDTQNIEQEKIEYNVTPKYINMQATLSDYYDISRNFYAGFASRFAAMIIDILIVLSLSRLVNTVTFGVLDFGYELPFIGYTPLYFITFFSYFVLMTLFFSQTIGKMILGIRVESNDNTKLSFTDVLFRELIGRFLNLALFSLPYLIIPFTNKKKGLHDFIADSVVVKEDFSKLRKKINDTMKEANKVAYKQEV